MEEEVIRKKISIDPAKSHMQGLMPYTTSQRGVYGYVNASSNDGNYGQYVCDFVVMSSSTINGVTVYDEVDRYRYCDLMKRYHLIEKAIEDGIELKRVEKSVPSSYDGCGEVASSALEYTWVSDFDRQDCNGNWIDTKSKYDFTLCNTESFMGNENGVYTLVNKDDDYSGDAYKYIRVVSDYDEVKEYLSEWTEKNEIWENSWRGILGYTDKYGYLAYEDYLLCLDVEKYILGKIYVPENFTYNGKTYKIEGVKVPQYIYYSDVPSAINYLNKLALKSVVEDGVRKWSDKKCEKKWDDNGGEAYLLFLNTLKITEITSKTFEKKDSGFFVLLKPPYVNVPILLSQSFECESLKTSCYEEEYREAEEGDSEEIQQILSLKPKYKYNLNCKVESQLSSLMSDDMVEVTDEIYGVWESAETLYKCIYYRETWSLDKKPIIKNNNVYQVVGVSIVESTSTGNTYEWWECIADSIKSNMVCGDGEEISSNDATKYRNVTILEEIPSKQETASTGDEYYFFAKNVNGYVNRTKGQEIDDTSGCKAKCLDIPYKVGELLSIDVDDDKIYGNMVLSAETSDSSITITYVVGGQFTNDYTYIDETGLLFQETLYYESEKTENIDLDDAYGIPIIYNSISAMTIQVYSEDYDLYRETSQSTLIGMEVQSIWTSASSVFSKLITKDSTDGMTSDPKVDFSLTLDRGTAAAWESHFKLSECNTLEDLENYGNNYFNL